MILNVFKVCAGALLLVMTLQGSNASEIDKRDRTSAPSQTMVKPSVAAANENKGGNNAAGNSNFTVTIKVAMRSSILRADLGASDLECIAAVLSNDVGRTVEENFSITSTTTVANVLKDAHYQGIAKIVMAQPQKTRLGMIGAYLDLCREKRFQITWMKSDVDGLLPLDELVHLGCATSIPYKYSNQSNQTNCFSKLSIHNAALGNDSTRFQILQGFFTQQVDKSTHSERYDELGFVNNGFSPEQVMQIIQLAAKYRSEVGVDLTLKEKEPLFSPLVQKTFITLANLSAGNAKVTLVL